MQHLAMIMDGNRRWAKSKRLQAVTMGHRKGVDAVKAAIRFCLKRGIKYLSLFTFSLENFRRDKEEQSYIFGLLVQVLKENIASLTEQGVRICFVGDRSFFPDVVLPEVEYVEQQTKHLSKLQLNMLFCYGARQELVAAVRSIAKDVVTGTLSPDALDEDNIRKNLWMGDVPDPDLIVRTGGRSRLSNFLLFQAAYSELLFVDQYWPEVTEEYLESYVEKFSEIKRNFGQ